MKIARRGVLLVVAVLLTVLIGNFYLQNRSTSSGSQSTPTLGSVDPLLNDASNGDNWPGYGRTYGEQHYSPLDDVNGHSVAKLGLAWSYDLGPGNPATIPVAVNGTLYFSSGLSVIHAMDATSGKLIWQYDPEVGSQAGIKLRPAWGNRGIAYWDGKIFTGTQDGRLIAINAQSGKPIWIAQTTEKGDGRYITGAPRVFDGKVIIGHGGADSSNARGYVTTYDARTGGQLWRFYIVPGNPANGFEDKAQEMAAKTWTGDWWKYGGGGAAWNAFTYDADSDTILIGTGNGSPWNQRIRSPGGGDNLFLCSIVALDAKTGRYRWHYQVNPGETWDYNAAMDMALATLSIGGRQRKVLLTAPKNGFFYVIDRTNGKFISAEKISRVTWATRIDPVTGRPDEVPGARFPNGKDFALWPSYTGAHSWMPMAFSPKTQMAYIPTLTVGAMYNDRGVDLKNWTRPGGNVVTNGVNLDPNLADPEQNTSALVAWDPVSQKQVWKVKTIGGWNGGVLATGGNLVFQGQLNGRLSAYAADTGRELWHFSAEAPIIGAPITYRANGKQYVTVLVGLGTSPGIDKSTHAGIEIDYRQQAKRVLTFVIGGTARLPNAAAIMPVVAPSDPEYRPDPVLARKGGQVFGMHCASCHGFNAVAGGTAPDLRVSPVVLSAESFAAVVHDGGLVSNGMPQFDDLPMSDLDAVRQYLRSRGRDLPEATKQK